MSLPGRPIAGRLIEGRWEVLREAPVGHGQRLLLAHDPGHINSKWHSPEPYVTWLEADDGDPAPFAGHYFATLLKAEADFTLRFNHETRR